MISVSWLDLKWNNISSTFFFLRESSKSVLYFTLTDCLFGPPYCKWLTAVWAQCYCTGQHSSRSPGLYSVAASSGVHKGMTSPLLRPILLLTNFSLSLSGTTTHSGAQVRTLLLIFPTWLSPLTSKFYQFLLLNNLLIWQKQKRKKTSL